jgi:hypothetical protein
MYWQFQNKLLIGFGDCCLLAGLSHIKGRDMAAEDSHW